MKKQILISAGVALLVSLCSIATFSYFQNNGKTYKIEHVNHIPASKAVFGLDENGEIIALDFTKVSEQVMDAVVSIKSTQTSGFVRGKSPQMPDGMDNFFQGSPFEHFFSPRFHFENTPNRNRGPQPRVGQGSGVIVHPDGYIITNNHVVADADDVEVLLHDQRSYKAVVVGTDPSTDLALLQIKEKNLPTLPFVDSDEVKIGEWVLAVGNPFNLNSTVTAGIVSAKGRNINILKEKFAVESFIQTDAAINPGNSGGALVDLQGGLIGINTAIASPTGAYSGYGFAVPANIVRKVMDDLMKYGVVQRGVLGVMIRDVNTDLAKEKELGVQRGVYVDSLLENSAAGTAGVQPGDVILAIDEVEVNTSSNVQEQIAQRRPGDEVKLKLDRKGKEKVISVILNNPNGKVATVKKEKLGVLRVLGVDLEEVENEKARKLDIPSGVQVKELYAGKIRRYTDMRKGFIITKLDGKPVRSVDGIVDALDGKHGGVMFEGIYEDLPGTHYYALGM